MRLKTKIAATFTPFGYGLCLFVFAVMLAIMLTRNSQAFWQHSDMFGHGSIGSHASNLALSMVLVFIAGVVSMMTRFSWKHTLLAAFALVYANFFVELFVPIFNRKDVIDAIYGTVGVMVALVLLLIMQIYGTRKSRATSNKA